MQNEGLINEIEDNFRRKEIRNRYQGIKSKRRGYQPKIQFYKDIGELVGGEREILKLWKEYFEKLLNRDEEQKTEAIETYVNADAENQDIEDEGSPNLVRVKE